MDTGHTRDAGILQRELGRFDVELPIERAWTPPASWYLAPEFLERERATVFARNWQYACPTDLLREPGRYVRVDLLGETYVLLRNDRGELRGFHNVCRHHAAELVDGEGCVEELVCPYHGWTYDLDGRLRRAPHMGAMRNFDRERFSLPAVEVETWGPLVFFHPGTPERPLERELAELEPRLAALGLEGLRHVARRRYPMECNWKVFADNYLDGGYHVGHLHHGLASQIDLTSYRTELFERFSIQSCPARTAPTDAQGHDFKERIGAGALYAFVYPNLMLNRYGPILDTNLVVPVSAERCEVVFDYWYPDLEPLGGESFLELSLAASDQVQKEDVQISERVQRGLRSTSYDRGRYAPSLEHGMLHFHRLLAADLRSA